MRKFIGEREVLVTRVNEIGIQKLLLEGQKVYGEDVVLYFQKGSGGSDEKE
ncbi:MAG: hypothetical protein ACTSVA_01070 [Candidatus Njordarchaeales archaeon]